MTQTGRISLDLVQIKALKHLLTGDRPYSGRLSLGFVLRLFQYEQERRESSYILRELDHLEGLLGYSSTKAASQFKHPPLHPFWKKHFVAPRHFLRNVGIRWGTQRGGNRDFSRMLSEVAKLHGDDVDKWQGIVAHNFVLQGYEERAARGLTGDWIVYAQHGGKNYYLDLATHEEGEHPDRLYAKLRASSNGDFPFAFDNGKSTALS